MTRAANGRDVALMRRALALAARGRGRTWPNPPVGAVFARGGRVVGEGHHRRAGGPHAEIAALRAAGDRARGAVLYVTLEPCTHTGRTGPCVAALLPLGLARVVVATPDPNPRVRGRGIRALRRAGVRVDVGVCRAEARELLTGYRTWVRRGRPEVVVKVAATLDGRIAAWGGDARWITGPAARRAGRVLRGEADAVLVGAGTVRADDPQLTTRIRGRSNPVRVVLAGVEARLPARAHVFDGAAPTWIVVPESTPDARVRMLERRGATVVRVPAERGRMPFAAVMEALGRRGLTRVLVEGGARVVTDALRSGVVDRVVWFAAPTLLGADAVPAIGPMRIGRAAEAVGLQIAGVERVGGDLMYVGVPVRRR